MIFIGSKGNKELPKGHYVGIDAERLARKSALPVFIVDFAEAFPPTKILVALDFSNASARAMGWATDFARLFGSSITVLHIAEHSDLEKAVRTFSAEAAEVAAELAQEKVSSFLEAFDIGGLDIMVRIGVGNPTEEILGVAEIGHFDMLAIGTLGRNALMEWLIGGTAERVIRHSPCAVLAVKPDTYKITRA